MRFAFLVLSLLAVCGCLREKEVAQGRPVPTPAQLQRHCEEAIGEPRVEEVADGVFVAIGYDLANTILVRTAEGNVVVDASMSPERAAPVREALLARSPGPVRAIIYTHSHVDHIGGASVWVEPGTEIWATDAFVEHFLKQYGLFRQAEQLRGGRQFGRDLDLHQLPCSGIGRRPDIAGAGTGIRLPTRTFSGREVLRIGGVEIELVEAHGETDDQLFVWLPAQRVLLPGDNFYEAFPNLYTLRGTRPRPVAAWISSLDEMRRRAPLHLVPSHTRPVSGEEEVASALTGYRDAIQWVRDSVVRGANAGEPVDALAQSIGLPPHLAGRRELLELYGQVDWSARAVFTNELGWFDGSLENLYPLPSAELARREIAMMGGEAEVRSAVRHALDGGDARWALHLLARLRRAGHGAEAIDQEQVAVLTALASEVTNPNGRAFLLQSARELQSGSGSASLPALDDELLAAIPIRAFFDLMVPQLEVAKAADVHETLRVDVEDEGRTFFITVRRGITEVVEGEALPGTPDPVGTISTDALTWKRLATRAGGPVGAIVSGNLKVGGNPVAVARFVRRFRPAR